MITITLFHIGTDTGWTTVIASEKQEPLVNVNIAETPLQLKTKAADSSFEMKLTLNSAGNDDDVGVEKLFSVTFESSNDGPKNVSLSVKLGSCDPVSDLDIPPETMAIINKMAADGSKAVWTLQKKLNRLVLQFEETPFLDLDLGAAPCREEWVPDKIVSQILISNDVILEVRHKTCYHTTVPKTQLDELCTELEGVPNQFECGRSALLSGSDVYFGWDSAATRCWVCDATQRGTLTALNVRDLYTQEEAGEGKVYIVETGCVGK